MADFGVKVKLKVDPSSRNDFNKEAQKLIKDIKIANFDADDAIKDLASKIQEGLNKHKFKIQISDVDIKPAVKKIKEEINSSTSGIKDSVINGLNNSVGDTKQIRQYSNQFVLSERNMSSALKTETSTRISLIDREAKALNSLTDKYNSFAASLKQGFKAIPKVSEANIIDGTYREISDPDDSSTSNFSNFSNYTEPNLLYNIDPARVAEITAKCKALQEQIRALRTETDKVISTSTYNKFLGWEKELFVNEDNLDPDKNSLTSILAYVKKLDDVHKTISNEFSDKYIYSGMKELNGATETFYQTLDKAYRNFGAWQILSRALSKVEQLFRNMIGYVQKLDTSMTELKKVTDETGAVYDRFLTDSITRAKSIGATVADTISASADYARLGYDLDDAAVLADTSLIYKNVGDGISSISEASDSVISTMKAFNIEAENSIHIVDAFNKVGNEFAISSGGIGEALSRSGAALAAGNNTLEESIGLATAMNSVVQNPEKVGTTLKTVSMYLRSAKVELEEAGEETEGMASSTSKLRKSILALTKNKVDIQLNENTFKSTYKILEEIAGVWSELSDIDQASLLELIGGKRNSNAVASLLLNFKTAQEAMQAAVDSTGSAVIENEKYLDSINGKIAQFNVSVEELSSTLIGSSIMKFFIDLGTAGVTFTTSLQKIHVLLPGIVALMATLNGYRQIQSINPLLQIVTLEGVETTSTAARQAVAKLSVEQRILAANTIYAARASDGLNREMAESIAKLLGLKFEIQDTSKNLVKFSNAQSGATMGLKDLWKASPAWSKVATGITIAASAIRLFYQLWKKHREELVSNAEEIEESFTEGSEQIETTQKQLKDLKAQFLDLSQGVDSNGKNISLTVDQYSEYLSLVEQICDLSPSVIKGYNSEGEALVNYTTLIQDAIAAQEELEQQNRKSYLGSGEDLLKGKKVEYEDALKELNQIGIKVTDALVSSDTMGGISSKNNALYDIYADMGLSNTQNAHQKWLQIYDRSDEFLHRLGDTGLWTSEQLDDLKISILSLGSPLESLNTIMDDSTNYLMVWAEEMRGNEWFNSLPDDIRNEFQEGLQLILDPTDTFAEQTAAVDEFGANFKKALEEDVVRSAIAASETVANGQMTLEDYSIAVSKAQTELLNSENNYGFVTQSIVKYLNNLVTAYETLGYAVEGSIAHIHTAKEKISDLWDSQSFKVARSSWEDLGDTAEITADEISELAEENTVLSDVLNVSGLTTGYLAKVFTKVVQSGGKLEDGLNLITKEALLLNEALKEQAYSFEEVSEARSKYEALLEESDQDDNFKVYTEAFEKFQEELAAGRVNSNSFWASVEFILGEDILEQLNYDVEAVKNAMTKVKSVFSDDESAGTAILPYLYNLQHTNKEIERLVNITKDSSGNYSFDIDTENIDQLAKAAGLNEEALLSCFEAMQVVGSIKYTDTNKFTKAIKNAGLSTEIAGEQFINFGKIIETLENSGNTTEQIEDAKNILLEMEDVTFVDLTRETDNLIEELEKLHLVIDNINNKQVEANPFIDALTSLGLAKDEIFNIIDEIDEEITFINSRGIELSPISVKTIVSNRFKEEVNDTIEDSTQTVAETIENTTDAYKELNNQKLTNIIKENDKLYDSLKDVNKQLKDCYQNINLVNATSLIGPKVVDVKNLPHSITTTNPFSSNATGSRHVEGGASLVGEEGIELMYHNGVATFLGTNGAEIVDMPKGAGIFNAKDTKDILSRSKGKLKGVIPSYAGESLSGTISLISSSSSDGSEASTDAISDALQDKIDELSDVLDDKLSIFEHNIYVLQKTNEQNKNASPFDLIDQSKQIIAIYRQMQNEVHLQADLFRSMGLSETSKEIRELQKQWREYNDSIEEIKESVVDNIISMTDDTTEAIDKIQSALETFRDAASEYASNGGFITADTFQEILELGAEYTQFLKDENGLLVINEDRINEIIKAKTEQLALETAMNYVARLRLAMEEGSIENLEQLLYATTEATDATWGLVYATLAGLGLTDKQYDAALHNINAIRSLAENTILGVDKLAKEVSLDDMKDGLDDIIKYTMDMLEDKIDRQVDALEDLKDEYAEIISLKKESLEIAREETDYQESVAEKVKEIAKIQEKINLLSLDDSREAQAQKKQLEEEMSELQKELADTQADYAYDKQVDSLDKMQDAYEDQKDSEIKILEESISSQQKLYDMAIDYISDNWDTLYSELIGWNYSYGSNLESEITSAWDAALAAAQRYGNFTSALKGVSSTENDISNNRSDVVGNSKKYNDSSSVDRDSVGAIVSQMYRNSQTWAKAGDNQSLKAQLDAENLRLGKELAQYGIDAWRDNASGVWYDNWGHKLYEEYKEYCGVYHSGGIVGDRPTLAQSEMLAVLENGEAVLTDAEQKHLQSLIKYAENMTKVLGQLVTPESLTTLGQRLNLVSNLPQSNPLSKAVPCASNHIVFGDVNITGANNETVQQHIKVNRDFVNEVLNQLNIKK